MKTNCTHYKTILILCTLFLLHNCARAQNGSLDLSFDTDGFLTKGLGVSDDMGFPIAIQSDGKIIMGGSTKTGADFDFTLLRFNPDGSLDSTFDMDGIVTTAVGAGDEIMYSIAIQSDGKILGAGWSYNGTNADFAIVRYNPNGSLDSTFHFDGKVTTNIGAHDDGRCLAIQSDGKIILAGASNNGNNYDFAIVRYNSNGHRDSTFDVDGIVTTTFGAGSDVAYSVAIENGGKIVVAGDTYAAPDHYFAVARYNIDGSLDNTFDNDGKVTSNVGNYHDSGRSVAIQNDGKILVAGTSANGSADDIAMARYNTDGSLDNTFDGDGLVTTSLGPDEDQAWSVALQSDGKIIVGGWSVTGVTSREDFALLRYNTNGSLDTTFDNDGIVTTAIGVYEDYGYSVALQSDGKIVMGGISWVLNNDQDFALARYNNSGVADDLFEINKHSNELTVYPNPFSTNTTLNSTAVYRDASLTVYNMFGYAVKQVSDILIGPGHAITLYRDDLPAGFYIVQVSQGNRMILSNKLVIID